MEYYSQHGQDKFLDQHIFKGLENGIFVDVGAYDGITNSNTLFLEKYRFWKGINIEPLPKAFLKLISERPNSINIPCAIASKCGLESFVYNSGYVEQLSGLHKTYDDAHWNRLNRELQIPETKSQIMLMPCLTLDQVWSSCKQQLGNPLAIDLLKIDVEGGELEVLQSIDLNNINVKTIMFEDNGYGKLSEIVEYLKSKGYHQIHSPVVDIIMTKNAQDPGMINYA